MTATDLFETEILQLIFTNVAFAGIGDGGGLPPSVGDGVFHISLHTGSLGDTSNQATTEATYTSYARQLPARNVSDWSVSGDTCDNDNLITFPTGTGGSGTVIDFGIGQDLTGVGQLHFFGALDSSLVTGNGVQPEFAVGALNITAA